MKNYRLTVKFMFTVSFLILLAGCTSTISYKSNSQVAGPTLIKGTCLVRKTVNDYKSTDFDGYWWLCEIDEKELLEAITKATAESLRAENIFNNIVIENEKYHGKVEYICQPKMKYFYIDANPLLITYISPFSLLGVSPCYSEGRMILEIDIMNTGNGKVLEKYVSTGFYPERWWLCVTWWQYVSLINDANRLLSMQMKDFEKYLEKNKYTLKKQCEGSQRENENKPLSNSVEIKKTQYQTNPRDYKPYTIAVWQLTPITGESKQIMHGLTEILRSTLQKSGKYKLIARGEMEKVMKEQDVSLNATCDTTDCAVEYGKMLSVEKFMVGSVTKIGKTYAVVLKLINVNTGEIEKTGQAKKSGAEDVLIEVVNEAAKDLGR